MDLETLVCLAPIAGLVCLFLLIRHSSKNSTSAQQSGLYRPVNTSSKNFNIQTDSSYEEVESDVKERYEPDWPEDNEDDDDNDDGVKEKKPSWFDNFIDDIWGITYRSTKKDEDDEED